MSIFKGCVAARQVGTPRQRNPTCEKRTMSTTLRRIAFLLTFSVMLGATSAVAQTASPDKASQEKTKAMNEKRPTRTRRDAAPAKSEFGEADPEIAAMLKEVSAERIQATIEKLVSFGNRSTLSAADEASVAAGKGIGAARAWIKSEFERYSKDCGGCLEVKVDDFMQEPNRRVKVPTQLINVYAVLKGTDPASAKRIYLVSGHYDSRNSDNFNVTDPAPGANDDGSGTAVSLECARVMSKHKFPATIIFLTVPGEEQGLNGSKHFAEMARKENWDIDAVLNNDIVGGDKSAQQNPNVVRVFSENIPAPILTAGTPASAGNPATPGTADAAKVRQIRMLGTESDAPSRELARYVEITGNLYGQALGGFTPHMIFRQDRFLRGGDHTSFNEEGFAAVRFTEWREDYNHQHQTPRTENGIEYGDWPKFVDFDYTAKVARVNAATLASLASAPAAPADVKIQTTKLENSTDLTWSASPDKNVDHYRVVWRDTTAPNWEHVMDVGNELKAHLDMSKDNVFFAVQSVDKKGHASLPVTPVPETGRRAE